MLGIRGKENEITGRIPRIQTNVSSFRRLLGKYYHSSGRRRGGGAISKRGTFLRRRDVSTSSPSIFPRESPRSLPQIPLGRLTLPRLEPILSHSPLCRFLSRTIHGVLGSHASALTATIHCFILFLRQRLFVTPLRDTEHIGGGKSVGETVKNKGSRVCGGKMREMARAAELWTVETGFSAVFYWNHAEYCCDSSYSCCRCYSHFAEITPSFSQWHQDLSKTWWFRIVIFALVFPFFPSCDSSKHNT